MKKKIALKKPKHNATDKVDVLKTGRAKDTVPFQKGKKKKK